MGSDWFIEIDGKKYIVLEISVCILMKLKCDVEVYFGEDIIDVVIMMFVYFNDVQCQVIKDVGQIVGFNVLWIVNELIVVVLVYGFDKGEKEQ